MPRAVTGDDGGVMAKPSQPPTTKARLFDADRSDRVVELDATAVAAIEDRQLLWVDTQVDADSKEGGHLLDLLPFDKDAVKRMWAAAPSPRLTVHGHYFLARVVVLRHHARRDESVVLDLAVARNVVLTSHSESVDFLDELDRRITGDTTLGEIDSTDFATVLMDGLVTSYLELTDGILAEVDRLDGEALKGTGRGDLLGDLVDLRHRIAAVRRALVAHRSVIAGMASADFQVIAGSDAAPRWSALTERFEGAIGAIDSAREALLGTFDIHMSRTAQRTNDVVKTLTVVSVLLLPAGVIAGFMGMNIKAPYSNDDPTIFWIVVALIILVAGSTLVVLRLRKWL